MKTKILSFILALSFFLSGFPIKTYANITATTQEECQKLGSAYQWSGSQGCILTSASATLQDQVRNIECKGLSGNEYDKCLIDRTRDYSKDQGLDEQKKTAPFVAAEASTTIAILTTFMTADYLMNRKKVNKEACQAPSLYGMFAAGLAAITGEVASQLAYRKRLKEIADIYFDGVDQNKINSEDSENKKLEASIENQKKAFAFLIEQEKARAKMMKMRKDFYTGVVSLYSAAGTLALFEYANFFNKNNTNCSFKSQVAQDLKTTQNWQPQQLLEFFFSSAFAKEEDSKEPNYKKEFKEMILKDSESVMTFWKNWWGHGAVALGSYTTLMTTSLLVKEGNPFKNFTTKALDTVLAPPYGRASYSAVLALYAGGVLNHAAKQEKSSNERVAQLESYLESFGNVAPAILPCTENDRNDSTKPECYCYTENNERNMARASHPACKNAWGSYTPVAAKDYNLNNVNSSYGSYCINSAYRVDENCSCKNNNGKNTCLRENYSSYFNALGASSWGKGFNDAYNSFFNGSFGSGATNANPYAHLAMLNKKAKDELIKKDKNIKPLLKKIAKDQKKLEAINLKQGQDFLKRNPDLLSKMASNSSSFNPKELLKEAAAEAKKALEYDDLKAKTASKEAKGMDFSFDSNSSSAGGVVVSELSEVMDKDFNYKDNDINNRPEDSLFKILTIRYQTTGLKKLFSE